MRTQSTNQEQYTFATIAGFMSLFLSICMVPLFIGGIAQGLELSNKATIPYMDIINYGAILFSVVMLFISVFAIAQYNVRVNIILYACAFIFLAVCFSQKNEIGEWAIKDRYSDINDLIIRSYPNIEKTQLYKDFALDKENNNKAKLKYYFENKNKYISIDTEKAMQLKLFYTSTKSLEIRNKLEEIFKDGLISKYEYEEFKNFIYDIQLSNDDQVFVSLVSLK